MGFKTGFVLGIGVGYFVATRLDPATKRRIESTVAAKMEEWRDDPRVKEVVDAVTSVTGDVVEAARGTSGP